MQEIVKNSSQNKPGVIATINGVVTLILGASSATFGEPIAQLVGNGECLHRIIGQHGGSVVCDALFFVSDTFTPVEFFQDLDCKRTEGGLLDCTNDIQTSIPRLFAAGNTSDGLQLAIVAAAEGAKAGWAINEGLLERD